MGRVFIRPWVLGWVILRWVLQCRKPLGCNRVYNVLAVDPWNGEAGDLTCVLMNRLTFGKQAD